jgi:hypothetical protein
MSEQLQEQKECEYLKQLVQVREDVRNYIAWKEELVMKKKEIQIQIVELENELKQYSEKIGLNHLRNEYNDLERRQNVPLITCCKHTKHKEISRDWVSCNNFCVSYCCNDCGYRFNSYSRIYKDLYNC